MRWRDAGEVAQLGAARCGEQPAQGTQGCSRCDGDQESVHIQVGPLPDRHVSPRRRNGVSCKRTWVKYNKGVGDASLMAASEAADMARWKGGERGKETGPRGTARS